MGLNFRKSFNLGKGFRASLSKSGVGFSWGVKGFRLSKKASGGARATFTLPGTGISYTKDFSAKKIKASAEGLLKAISGQMKKK